MVAQVLPSAVDQLTTAAPLGSDHLKKKHLVIVSNCKQHASSNQVSTELFSHYAPRCSLCLVAARLIFCAYLKLSNASLGLPGPTLQLGLILSHPKDFGHRQ
jgi:hypothetical protein